MTSMPAPTPPAAPKKNNTVLIVVIVLVVLCCCCALAVGAFYQYGDQILQQLGIPLQ